MQAVVQLRGEVDMSGATDDTLRMMNIHAVNHCALVPETDSYRGMITKVNEYVAHGTPSAEMLEMVLSSRAEPVEGDTEVDEAWLAEHTDYEDFAALADALLEEETSLAEQGLTPVLRLHPPRGGHEGIKHPTKEGGQLGKHTSEEIDELLEAMR
jgi:large subunit ribosomal protein L30